MNGRGVALLLATTLVVACSAEEDGAVQPPGIPPAPNVGEVALPAAPAPATPPQEEQQPFGDFFAEQAEEAEPNADSDSEAAEEESDEEEERDLGQELVALLRPSACIDLRAGGYTEGSTVQIGASAVVLPSGRLQGASAQVAGQPAGALQCLAAQLEAGHLQPPIEGAPTRVTGSLSLEVHGAPSRTPVAGD